MDTNRLILGLTGAFGSGCTEVAKYLESEEGYQYISLSKILEEKAKTEKIPFQSRKEKQEAGKRLRKKEGGETLSKLAEDQVYRNGNNIVIECFRNHQEVEYFFKKYTNFFLIALYAPWDSRWERKKDEYERNQNEFEIDETRDQEEDDEYGQQIKKCVGMADLLIKNNEKWSSARIRGEFFSKLNNYIRLFSDPFRPPDPHEINMHIAYSLSLMSSCLQRNVGAIITTSDCKNIISWGYNEVPINSNPCHIEHRQCYRKIKKLDMFNALKIVWCPFCGKKIGQANPLFNCPRCKKNLFKVFNSAKGLDFCRALHAEENAILQNVFVGGGSSLVNTVLFSTTFPCYLCAKKIVNAGINQVIYVEPYPLKESVALLKDSHVEIAEFEGIKAQAFYKVFKSRRENLLKKSSKEGDK